MVFQKIQKKIDKLYIFKIKYTKMMLLFLKLAATLALVNSELENLVIVRPFCNKDYIKMIDSFDKWNDYLPCNKEDTTKYHIVLSYSRNLNTGFGKEHVFPVISKFIDNYNRGKDHTNNLNANISNNTVEGVKGGIVSPYNNTKTITPVNTSDKEMIGGNRRYQQEIVSPSDNKWYKCISSIQVHSANVPISLDIYHPEDYNHDINWVNGPNTQFLSIVEWFKRKSQHSYNLWFLMESDTVPVKEYFLSTLSKEIILERPFAILGSIYRGDKWDMMMDKINPSLKYHINGNAVYNQSHPVYQIVIDQLNKEKRGNYRRYPYDYRISQIIYQNDLIFQLSLKWNDKSFFYKGWFKFTNQEKKKCCSNFR